MTIQTELLKSLSSHGERTAIVSGTELISYASLLDRSNKVTAHLLSQNIEKETIIGICLVNRYDIICVMIGVINARCVFALIDPSLPQLRRSAMCKDLNLQNAIISIDTKHQMDMGQSMNITSLEEILKANSGDDLTYPSAEGDDSLYIYFTSGTTGNPKGIVGKNESLLQFIQWEIEAFGVSTETRVSQLINPYFDAFMRDVFLALLSGGTLCIPPIDDQFFSPETLTSWIERSQVNLIHCVPSIFRSINGVNLSNDNFPNLRHILMSGERIIPSELLKWYDIFGTRVQLANLYGATETTMIRSYYLIQPVDAKSARIPIGTPIYDTEFIISNKDFIPCRTLEPGDLYIVSKYTSKGYLNNPELTHEKFISFHGADGKVKIAYKTGDKARMLTNGTIDLIGRDDRQVKLRGIRIELDEIENVLMKSTLVKTAVALKHTEENGDDSLIAFVVRNGGSASTAQLMVSLQQFLAENIAAYMIPSNIVEIDDIPKLSNGKIDYKTLVDQMRSREIVLPCNDIETRILEIWKEILGDKPISVKDSFHKIGGNSLSIMKLIGRIYKEYNIRVSLSDLFNNLTIRSQAELVKACRNNILRVVSKLSMQSKYHASTNQEAMYLYQQSHLESTQFNRTVVLELHPSVDIDKLEIAVRSLLRHDILRTSFTLINHELFQTIKESVDLIIQRYHNVDSGLEEIRGGFIKPFDLHSAPLMRCGVVFEDDNKRFLMMDFHEIVCDSLSIRTILSELHNLYNGVAVSPLVLQFKDYADWEYDFRSTPEYLAYREFWLRNFEGELPIASLSSLSTEASAVGSKMLFREIELDRHKLLGFIRELDKRNVEIASGFFAIYLLFLSQLSGQEDVIVGWTSSGRQQSEVAEMVGPFEKTMPVRYRLDYSYSVINLVSDVNISLRQARENQLYDTSNIPVDLDADSRSQMKRLFDAVFDYENLSAKEETQLLRLLPNKEISSKYPLVLSVVFDGESWRVIGKYSSECFKESDIELITGQFKSLAEKIFVNIESTLIEAVEINTSEPNQAIEEDVSFNF